MKIKNSIMYHESSSKIEVLKFSRDAVYGEYGYGFYCTEELNLHLKQAIPTTGKKTFINEYTLDSDWVKVLNLERFPVEVWLALIINNRKDKFPLSVRGTVDKFLSKFLIRIDKCDIICGYRAGDYILSLCDKFCEGLVSKDEIVDVVCSGDLSFHLCIKSESVLNGFKFVRSYEVLESECRALHLNRDLEALKNHERFMRSLDDTECKISSMLSESYNNRIYY